MADSNKGKDKKKEPIHWYNRINQIESSWKKNHPKLFALSIIFGVVFSLIGGVTTVFSLIPDYDKQFFKDKALADIRSEYGTIAKVRIEEVKSWNPFVKRIIVFLEFDGTADLNLNFDASVSVKVIRGNQTEPP